MKMTKKIMSLAIVFAMVMALAVSASAATITIDNAVNGETYKAYKIFDVTKNGDAYAYTISTVLEDGTTNPWFAVVQNYATAHTNELTLTVSSSDATLYVVDGSDLVAKTFAAHLMSNIPQNATVEAQGNGAGADLELTVADAGYYLVDSTLGALCVLHTAADTVTVEEKNAKPSIAKKVREYTTDAWADTTDADMSQVVYFQLTVNTGTSPYATEELGNGVDADYRIVDTLPVGLTVNEASYAVDGWEVDEYTVTVNGQVVTIILNSEKLATLGENADIVITYNATVNTNATVGTEGNTNNVTLTYKNQTSTADAVVYTFEIPVHKHTSDNSRLAGAKFVLKNTATNKFATLNADNKVTGWVDTQAEATEIISSDSENVKFIGVDADNYHLIETEAPAGYNILTTPVNVTVADDGDINGENGVEVKVLNETGAVLPSTGGIGTTIFYALGGLMAVGAGVLLVAKKRMEA